MSIVRVAAGASRAEFESASCERVLHAALRAGFDLPHECATGTCGTCRATITAGNATALWPEAPGTAKLRAPGDVLMCQIAANDELALSVRGKIGRLPHPPEYCDGRIVGRRALTPDIIEFAVQLAQPLRFVAGQFVLLEFADIAGPRAYSMTTYRSEASANLHFLIRNTGTGQVSRRLFTSPPDEGPVRVFGPLGKAIFDPAGRRPFLAIAGGSGIAGMLSILDHAGQTGHFSRHPSRLVFALRAPGATYLLDELAAAVRAAAGGLTVLVAFSDEPAALPLAAAYPELRFVVGFAHEVARDLPPVDGDVPIHYVAGPPAMVDATLRMLVLDKKTPSADIRYDRFG